MGCPIIDSSRRQRYHVQWPEGLLLLYTPGGQWKGKNRVKEEGALTSLYSSSVGRSTQSGAEVGLCVTVCDSPVSSVRLEVGKCEVVGGLGTVIFPW